MRLVRWEWETFRIFCRSRLKACRKERETKEPTSAAGWECSRTANLVESGCGVIARKSWWRKKKGGRGVGEKFMGGGLWVWVFRIRGTQGNGVIYTEQSTASSCSGIVASSSTVASSTVASSSKHQAARAAASFGLLATACHSLIAHQPRRRYRQFSEDMRVHAAGMDNKSWHTFFARAKNWGLATALWIKSSKISYIKPIGNFILSIKIIFILSLTSFVEFYFKEAA